MPKANPNKPDHIRARQSEASRRYRAKYKSRISASNKKIYLNRRIRVFELLGGAYCAGCGCDEVGFLEINHIDGGGCKELGRLNQGLTDLILAKRRTIEGLNVLCRVCNALDHLRRKNPEACNGFVIRFEKFSGQKAAKL